MNLGPGHGSAQIEQQGRVDQDIGIGTDDESREFQRARSDERTQAGTLRGHLAAARNDPRCPSGSRSRCCLIGAIVQHDHQRDRKVRMHFLPARLGRNPSVQTSAQRARFVAGRDQDAHGTGWPAHDSHCIRRSAAHLPPSRLR